MGCNSSRAKDIETDRQRTRRPAPSTTHKHDTQQQSSQSGTATTNKPRTDSIAIGGKGDLATGLNDTDGTDLTTGAYGTSYTNQKTAEYEQLNQLMKQTQYNFIDISTNDTVQLASIDESSEAEKYRRYVSLIDLMQFESPTHSGAPPPASQQQQQSSGSKSVLALVGVMGSSVGSDDVELITTACENVSVAISDIHMKDVGQFVLSFDEL